MDAVLPLATLLVLWPSLLPRWRAMLVATLLLGLALAALMFIALDHLDRPAGGDGPAFFAMVLLYALGQGLLLGACAARTLIQAGMARLSPRHRATCRRALWSVLLPVGLAAGIGALAHWVAAGVALSLGTAMLWLAIVVSLPVPAAPGPRTEAA